MSEAKDPYYNLPEVSNSDLSWLQKYWQAEDLVYDLERAYRFGTLIDCMITEPHKINFFKLTCAGEAYTKDEFAVAEQMKRSFYRDPFCRLLAEKSEFQKITVRRDFPISHEGFDFKLHVRCKWDLNAKRLLRISGDIKSTTATTEKQFLEACHHFNYFRQRAWYMDIDDVDRDMLIGISKVSPYRLFKIPIERGGELYAIGKQQYQQLAFKWFYLFSDINELYGPGDTQARREELVQEQNLW